MTQVSRPRWQTFAGLGLAGAAVIVIGLTSVVPARADYDDWRDHQEWREHRDRERDREAWREREWREDHPRSGVYLNFGNPQPGYYYQSNPY